MDIVTTAEPAKVRIPHNEDARMTWAKSDLFDQRRPLDLISTWNEMNPPKAGAIITGKTTPHEYFCDKQSLLAVVEDAIVLTHELWRAHDATLMFLSGGVSLLRRHLDIVRTRRSFGMLTRSSFVFEGAAPGALMFTLRSLMYTVLARPFFVELRDHRLLSSSLEFDSLSKGMDLACYWSSASLTMISPRNEFAIHVDIPETLAVLEDRYSVDIRLGDF